MTRVASFFVFVFVVVAAFALPAAAQSEGPVRGLTPDRATATVGIVLALVGAVLGGTQWAGARRGVAVVALGASVVGAVVGGVVVATAEGGLGTGHGLGGGVVAIVVGVVGVALGLRRARRGP